MIDAATSSATGNAPAISRAWYLSLVLFGSAIFLGYSTAFLYFFVDDEAIPLVYAVNLARGRGLIYTALEGRVEGYSNFLQVLWSWVVFEATSIAHGQRLTVLLVGKGVSLLAGLCIVIVCARTMRRCDVGRAGMTAGLVFLALAGPLAVWSCSSLETVPFSLMLAGLWSIGLVDLEKARWAPVAAVVLATAAILERIDGILYVLVILGAVTPLRGDRRMRLTVFVGIGAIAVAYHAWRFTYFGTLFSAPLLAKVLYHLEPPRHAMVKEPAVPYFIAFLRLYGLAAAIGLAGALAVAWRVPPARRTIAAAAVLAAYVAVVGDWMFGWRFTVPLLPLVAFVIGCAVTRAPSRWAWALTAVVGFLSVSEARAFTREYVAEERRPIFWTAPRAGLGAWLAPYYDLINTSRPLIRPGERIAYNQAGLLPYLLDAENIDDLGICSKFVAGLPTTDVYYTRWAASRRRKMVRRSGRRTRISSTRTCSSSSAAPISCSRPIRAPCRTSSWVDTSGGLRWIGPAITRSTGGPADLPTTTAGIPTSSWKTSRTSHTSAAPRPARKRSAIKISRAGCRFSGDSAFT